MKITSRHLVFLSILSKTGFWVTKICFISMVLFITVMLVGCDNASQKPPLPTTPEKTANNHASQEALKNDMQQCATKIHGMARVLYEIGDYEIKYLLTAQEDGWTVDQEWLLKKVDEWLNDEGDTSLLQINENNINFTYKIDIPISKQEEDYPELTNVFEAMDKLIHAYDALYGYIMIPDVDIDVINSTVPQKKAAFEEAYENFIQVAELSLPSDYAKNIPDITLLQLVKAGNDTFEPVDTIIFSTFASENGLQGSLFYINNAVAKDKITTSYGTEFTTFSTDNGLLYIREVNTIQIDDKQILPIPDFNEGDTVLLFFKYTGWSDELNGPCGEFIHFIR